MNTSTLVDRARAFALRAHEGQVRPNKARDPYSSHIEDVARLVELSGGTAEEIAAAWLHDTVEDTGTSLDQIRQLFGETVAHIVDGLTDKSDITGLPTLQRKKMQAERVRSKCRSVKRVKLADQATNVRSVAVDPPTKWNRDKCRDYIEGARLIAKECREVSHLLYSEFEIGYAMARSAHN